jgi:hypothetical protein
MSSLLATEKHYSPVEISDRWGLAPSKVRELFAAGLSDGPLAPTPPARVADKASQLFCDDLLQHMPVETQVCYQALQLRVLLAQLAQLAQLA